MKLYLTHDFGKKIYFYIFFWHFGPCRCTKIRCRLFKRKKLSIFWQVLNNDEMSHKEPSDSGPKTVKSFDVNAENNLSLNPMFFWVQKERTSVKWSFNWFHLSLNTQNRSRSQVNSLTRTIKRICQCLYTFSI